jgi:hypothetical protein
MSTVAYILNKLVPPTKFVSIVQHRYCWVKIQLQSYFHELIVVICLFQETVRHDLSQSFPAIRFQVYCLKKYLTITVEKNFALSHSIFYIFIVYLRKLKFYYFGKNKNTFFSFEKETEFRKLAFSVFKVAEKSCMQG